MIQTTVAKNQKKFAPLLVRLDVHDLHRTNLKLTIAKNVLADAQKLRKSAKTKPSYRKRLVKSDIQSLNLALFRQNLTESQPGKTPLAH